MNVEAVENEQFLENNESDSDSELKITLKFGYLVNLDGDEVLRLKVNDEKIIDSGLIAGLTQNNNFVDAQFFGNKKMKESKKDIIFEKSCVKANGKEYDYNEIIVQMTPHEAVVISKKENEFIVKLNEEAHDMFSSVIDNDINTYIISVINSKICACYISDGEVVWVNSIDIDKNTFNEETSLIETVDNKTFNLEDCYLRACLNKIYLHVDDNEPLRTLILGVTDSPFEEKELKQNYIV